MTPRFYLCIITRTQIIKWIIPSYQELFVGPKNIPRAAYFSKTDKELHPKLSQKNSFVLIYFSTVSFIPVYIIRFSQNLTSREWIEVRLKKAEKRLTRLTSIYSICRRNRTEIGIFTAEISIGRIFSTH